MSSLVDSVVKAMDQGTSSNVFLNVDTPVEVKKTATEAELEEAKKKKMDKC